MSTAPQPLRLPKCWAQVERTGTYVLSTDRAMTSRARRLSTDEASPRGPGAVDVAFLGDALAARERRSPAVFRGPHRLEFLFLLEAFDSVTEQRTAIGGSGGKGSGVLEQSRRRLAVDLRRCALCHARANRTTWALVLGPPPAGLRLLTEKTNESSRCSAGSRP